MTTIGPRCAAAYISASLGGSRKLSTSGVSDISAVKLPNSLAASFCRLSSGLMMPVRSSSRDVESTLRPPSRSCNALTAPIPACNFAAPGLPGRRIEYCQLRYFGTRPPESAAWGIVVNLLACIQLRVPASRPWSNTGCEQEAVGILTGAGTGRMVVGCLQAV